MTDDPGFWPAHRQAAAIRNRECSSVELLEHYLGRIERLNPALNAVVTVAVGTRPDGGAGR